MNRRNGIGAVGDALLLAHARAAGGPTRAQTYMVGDTLICALNGGVDPAVDATEIVEPLTGRRVLAHSRQCESHGYCVEVFLLAPPLPRGGVARGPEAVAAAA
jgi:hypothetical protein